MTESEAMVESISAEVHKCYCRAYERRFGEPYWTGGDYSKLDEPTKDYDREMARYLIAALKAAKMEERERCAKVAEKQKMPDPNEALWQIGSKIATAIRQQPEGEGT